MRHEGRFRAQYLRDSQTKKDIFMINLGVPADPDTMVIKYQGRELTPDYFNEFGWPVFKKETGFFLIMKQEVDKDCKPLEFPDFYLCSFEVSFDEKKEIYQRKTKGDYRKIVFNDTVLKSTVCQYCANEVTIGDILDNKAKCHYSRLVHAKCKDYYEAQMVLYNLPS